MIKILPLMLLPLLFGGIVFERALGQSGRKMASERSRPAAPEASATTGSRLVLGLMNQEDAEACGLTKLSEEELDRLDRWILRLMLTMSASPSGELHARSAREERWPDPLRSAMELELSDLRARLAEIRQASAQLALDLSRARLALQRRDLAGVEFLLSTAESTVARLQRAAP
ncbi:hypothetical protein HRbin10_01855 [bacterium HR10]|nr:hypothetical protein HRbin10_01855 [bacterium HR10]